jgi:phosphate transport system protein
MERTIDNQLLEVKQDILDMGSHVELALKIAIDGLLRQDESVLKSVHDHEIHINDLQLKIDNSCMMILAKQGPVAKDLRMILSIIKMNTDIERMGDQCVNIAYLAKDIIRRGQKFDIGDIEKMSIIASLMVKLSLESFVKLDTTLAEDVMKMDDDVDQYKNVTIKFNIENIKKDVSRTETFLDLILVSRNLERIGDHSTNIAEDVIFASLGKDVRHGS